MQVQVNSPEVGYLNLRASPATSGALVTQIKDQTILAVIEPDAAAQGKIGQQGAWLQVQTPDGQSGYAAAWYLKLIDVPPVEMPAPVSTTLQAQVDSPEAGYLNLRASPSTGGALITQVKDKTILSIIEVETDARAKIGQQGAWLQVQIPGGQSGYAAAWYLRLVEPSSAPATKPVPPTTPVPVQPPVPVRESYGQLPVVGWQPAERKVEEHGDINLALRGYTPTADVLGLVDVGGDTDVGAPQLAGVFCPARAPSIKAVSRVREWNWGANAPGDPIEEPPVTLIELAATPGEPVCLPDRVGGDVGRGYKALVLYASAERLTLKYTGEDTVAGGYALHLEHLSVDQELLALYQTLDRQGRHELPAVRAGQAVGYARGDRVKVALRDTGAFMDPRVRKDWWRGY